MRRRRSLLWLSWLPLCAAVPACSKDEPPPQALLQADGDDERGEPSPTTPAAANPREDERRDAGATAGSTVDGSAPLARATATRPPPAADGGLGCGAESLPDCPMQAWMKAHTSAAIVRKDLPALADALETVATFAPGGYTNWVSIAKDGAAAARAEKLDAVKAACRGCHEQYRAKYKAEHRARPLS